MFAISSDGWWMFTAGVYSCELQKLGEDCEDDHGPCVWLENVLQTSLTRGNVD